MSEAGRNLTRRSFLNQTASAGVVARRCSRSASRTLTGASGSRRNPTGPLTRCPTSNAGSTGTRKRSRFLTNPLRREGRRQKAEGRRQKVTHLPGLAPNCKLLLPLSRPDHALRACVAAFQSAIFDRHSAISCPGLLSFAVRGSRSAHTPWPGGEPNRPRGRQGCRRSYRRAIPPQV